MWRCPCPAPAARTPARSPIRPWTSPGIWTSAPSSPRRPGDRTAASSWPPGIAPPLPPGGPGSCCSPPTVRCSCCGHRMAPSVPAWGGPPPRRCPPTQGGRRCGRCSTSTTAPAGMWCASTPRRRWRARGHCWATRSPPPVSPRCTPPTPTSRSDPPTAGPRPRRSPMCSTTRAACTGCRSATASTAPRSLMPISPRGSWAGMSSSTPPGANGRCSVVRRCTMPPSAGVVRCPSGRCAGICPVTTSGPRSPDPGCCAASGRAKPRWSPPCAAT